MAHWNRSFEVGMQMKCFIVFYIFFYPVWIKSSKRYADDGLLSGHDFCKNRPSVDACTFNIHSSVHSWYFRTVQPTRCDFSQFIYFCKTLYMFQTDFPSIIRSSKLHIQRQVLVRPLLLPAASLARLAAGSSNGLTYTVPDAVLSSWWWTEKPSETCTASYRNK